jgi:hypothetical protein
MLVQTYEGKSITEWALLAKQHQAVLDEVLREAVWAMNELTHYMGRPNHDLPRATAFLDSERVRKWRERQGKESV